ncbi:putative LPPG:FO 2-phospho-L-lactate transferase CofD/UPF0052 [Rosa chinensis]|uniref:Putative LPPG:FO 2-phospho-L-lactate transferase CofD/UPF0052 n=1 Tax=Rosa chinensis TaxID=74649 RepID=A0A2P6Q4L8_ROSCH|nr:putative LPPG:FO 2-phospho-L-lactate transferase CofD/UPF0052 [Rosa chinensis]
MKFLIQPRDICHLSISETWYRELDCFGVSAVGAWSSDLCGGKLFSSWPPALSSRIKRMFYMSNEGQNLLLEVFPSPNAAVMDQLRNVDCIVYAMGSLFTSVCPSLVLIGIGEIISSRSCPKVPSHHTFNLHMLQDAT